MTVGMRLGFFSIDWNTRELRNKRNVKERKSSRGTGGGTANDMMLQFQEWQKQKAQKGREPDQNLDSR